jgi:hypothetical protein
VAIYKQEMAKVIHIQVHINNLIEYTTIGKMLTLEEYTYLFSFFELFTVRNARNVFTKLCFGDSELLKQKTFIIKHWKELCKLFHIQDHEISMRKCVDECKEWMIPKHSQIFL